MATKTETTLDLIRTLKAEHKAEMDKCTTEAERLTLTIEEHNVLLMDIACSLAIIADDSTKTYCYFCGQTEKNGNTQESGNETLHWVHSEPHKVMCPKCGCRVSINAACEMNYCFKCGAKLG